MQVCCSTHWVCIDDRRNTVVVQVSLSSHHPLHTDDTYRGEEGWSDTHHPNTAIKCSRRKKIRPDLHPLPYVLTLDHGYSHQWHRCLGGGRHVKVNQWSEGGGEGGRKMEKKVDRVELLWYAGLELLIHWHASSLIQSNTNILRKENKRS